MGICSGWLREPGAGESIPQKGIHPVRANRTSSKTRDLFRFRSFSFELFCRGRLRGEVAWWWKKTAIRHGVWNNLQPPKRPMDGRLVVLGPWKVTDSRRLTS